MKTETEIKAKLKEYQKELKTTQKRFEKYDNHDDMDLIPVLEQVVDTLTWVLSK